MPSLTEFLIPVITLASITCHVQAYHYEEDALENLQAYEVAKSKHLKDTYHDREPRADEDNDSNMNSLSIQDLSALLEKVLSSDADYEAKKRTHYSKKQRYNTYLNQLNEQKLVDLLVNHPDSKKSARTDDKEIKAVLNKLGLSDAKPTSGNLKVIHQRADQKTSQVNKKTKYEKNYFDLLNELDWENVVLYDPDSDRKIRTERKQNYPLIDLLGATNNNVDSDELNNNEALVYIVHLNADSIRNGKFGNSIKDLVSTQFEMSSSSQKDRSDRRKENRYKGFRVKNIQRRMRADTEKFASEEAEEKRPVKRPHRGFGGVARTPIPYIRHRGDIYEKY